MLKISGYQFSNEQTFAHDIMYFHEQRLADASRSPVCFPAGISTNGNDYCWDSG
jgi:hypothetical protein